LAATSNVYSNKKEDNPKCLKASLQINNSALLRRWLWVRGPPNPKLLFGFESPLSRYWSHSADGGAQSDEPFLPVVWWCLLLFFWVTLVDLTFLTPVWCTSPYFMTLLASSI
jgi:hypothetical protein